MCGNNYETCFHCFIECPKYCVQRHLLIQKIDSLRLQIPFPVHLILNGDIRLTYEQTIAIFRYVHKFIKSRN